MKLHLARTGELGRELQFLSLTQPDRHEGAEPGWRDTLFSVASITWYRSQKGLHLLRVKDARCPADFPDRSLLGFALNYRTPVLELLWLKISIE